MNNTFFLIVIGLLSIVGGVLAFFNPLAATLTAEQLIAFLFLLVGSLQILSVWQYRKSSIMKWLMIGGLVSLLIGFFLLFKPLQGLLALTAIIAVLLLLGGVSRISFALFWKGTPAFFPMLVSGILSLLLSGFIFADFPQAAETILGIFLAVDLISNGVAMLFLSRHR